MIYNCSICGKPHKIFTKYSLPEPHILFDMPPEERKRRVHLLEGRYFLIDKTFYLTKARLVLGIVDNSKNTYWDIWIKLYPKDITFLAGNLDKTDLFILAEFMSDLPIISNPIGQVVNVRFQPHASSESLPEIKGVTNKESTLGKAYYNGIPLTYFSNWMYH